MNYGTTNRLLSLQSSASSEFRNQPLKIVLTVGMVVVLRFRDQSPLGFVKLAKSPGSRRVACKTFAISALSATATPHQTPIVEADEDPAKVTFVMGLR